MKNLLIMLGLLSSFFSQAQKDTLKPIYVKSTKDLFCLPPYEGGRAYYCGDKRYDIFSAYKLENTFAASLDTVAMAYFVKFDDERIAGNHRIGFGSLVGGIIGPITFFTGGVMYQPLQGKTIGLPILIIGLGLTFIGIHHFITKGPHSLQTARKHLHQAIESYNNSIRRPVSFEVKPYFDSQNVGGVSLCLSF